MLAGGLQFVRADVAVTNAKRASGPVVQLFSETTVLIGLNAVFLTSRYMHFYAFIPYRMGDYAKKLY